MRHDPANSTEAAPYQNYGQGGFRTFEPGRGYWLLKRQGLDLQVQGTAAEIDQNREFTMQLQEGWNLIGNPFPFEVNVSALGDGTKRYFRENGYEDASGMLKPYEGVFVNSSEASALTISALRDEGSRQSAAPEGIVSFRNNPIDSDRWYVGLTVANGYLTNNLIGVGMHEEARDAQDRFDVPPMPRFPRFVEAQFVNEWVEKPLERDIVAPATQHTWTFALVADPASEEINITWDHTPWGNNDRQLLLLNTEAQRLIDMRDITHYSFRPTQPERTFRAILRLRR